jgi:uncharacterized NAD-dependent epimerase/dehydratase family protein
LAALIPQLCVKGMSARHIEAALAERGIEVTWLATNQSTRLEYTTNLPAVWQNAAVTPALTNGQFMVQWTNAVPWVFFRLRAW